MFLIDPFLSIADPGFYFQNIFLHLSHYEVTTLSKYVSEPTPFHKVRISNYTQ